LKRHILSISLIVAVIMIISIFTSLYGSTPVTKSADSTLVDQKISAKVIILGHNDFINRIGNAFYERVETLITMRDLKTDIVQHADKNTILVIDGSWLIDNAERNEVKEVIKIFAESGALIYVYGSEASHLFKILKETGVEKFPRIPQIRTGAGYMKITPNYFVVIYGAKPDDILSTFIEHRKEQ